MMFNNKFAYLLLTLLPALVRGEALPATPPQTDEGGPCQIQWTADPTKTWTSMTIELMTGPNQQMIHMRTIAVVDGTNPNNATFTWDCPFVTPNSAIYFYQLSSSVTPNNLTWSTRFAIAGTAGTTTPPANQTQPDGSAPPWGIGYFIDPSEYNAIPGYLIGNGQVQGGPGTGTSTTATNSVSQVTPPANPPPSNTGSGGLSTTTKGSLTSSSTSSSASATKSSSAQKKLVSGAWVVAGAAVFGGVVASL